MLGRPGTVSYARDFSAIGFPLHAGVVIWTHFAAVYCAIVPQVPTVTFPFADTRQDITSIAFLLFVKVAGLEGFA